MRLGRVAVVGGSIAGCAAALAVARAGADEVVVLERAAQDLQDRGVGLSVHAERYAELAELGYLDESMPWVRIEQRVWSHRDGELFGGRRFAVQPFAFRTYNWGSLWRELRGRIPAAVSYRTGAVVAEVRPDEAGAAVRLADGSEERFDLVVGADGYRSVVRAAVDPGDRAAYGGYLAWRGTLPVEQLPDWSEALLEGEAATVCFTGGHVVAYRTPGPGGRGQMVNWVLYAVPDQADELRFDDPEAASLRELTPGLERRLLQLAEQALPPFWGEVVRRTPPGERFVQPMYDLAVERYSLGRVVLLGDAASIARPHTGSGAVKALQDASALERALRTGADLAAALAAYSAERAEVGRKTRELGHRLGVAQVQQTPDWSLLGQQELDQWWLGVNAGAGFGGHALRR
ncbi:monooxygenase [Streptomyces tateyamensis]|uniref:Monooxygenase n=1 Tax=Streptomyces tateyamensis TaxID=565073 RepID=A0A2V4NH55_9ACTN|nr:FAD-dependent monooxygenase [Streptomyces tateyamensis]PYC66056.1 monooxygenase [Streptomyces tateyamensis]